jgi:D-arabinose 1-dehydrogenase-like Zn-dependent alcohol dehydrogenase
MRAPTGTDACGNRLRWARTNCCSIREGYGLQSDWDRHRRLDFGSYQEARSSESFAEVFKASNLPKQDYVFNSRTDKDYVKKIKDLTNGKGADTVAVFSAAGAAYRSAPPLVKLGGIILVVGLPDAGVTFNALDIAIGTFKVRGDSTGTPARMPRAIEFTAKHNIQPETEVYHSLDDVPGMVQKMKDGKATRKMVVSLG